jgi:predicted RNA-binding Zn-ribbon protein involved in translation (DUF1610 family)
MIHAHMLPKARSKAIMSAARQQPCTLRVSSLFPGHFCSGVETTVACHLPVDGKGVATKVTDTSIAFGCSNCHDIVDGRDRNRRDYIMEKAPTAFMERLLRAHCETITRLWMDGVIQITDQECQHCKGGDAPPDDLDGFDNWRCPACGDVYSIEGDE